MNLDARMFLCKPLYDQQPVPEITCLNFIPEVHILTNYQDITLTHISVTEKLTTGAIFGLCMLFVLALILVIKRLKLSVHNSQKETFLHKYGIDNASYLILWVDAEGSLRYMNNAALKITGFQPDIYQSHKIWEINCNLTRELWPQLWDTVKTKGSSTFEGMVMNIQTGEDIIFEQTFNFIQFEDNQLLMGFYQDITERKMTEKALIESEERYRTLVDQSPNPIAVANKDKEFVYLNTAAQILFGITDQNEIMGHKVLEIIHPDSKQFVEDRFKKLQLGIGNEPAEIKLQVANGKVIYIMSSSIPITLSGEEAVLIVSHDITEYKKVLEALNENEFLLKQQNEEYISVNDELIKSNQRIQQINLELMKSRDRAEESDRLKSAFLANLSHEIRTPMNGIMGFSELLQKRELTPEKIQKYTQLISHNSHQLLAIINDIVEISKIESGQVTIQLMPTNINKMINDIKLILEAQINEKGLTLSTKADLPYEQAEIITDEPRLRHILLNLLYNALKFTHKGSIAFGYKIKSDHIEFFVSDTGIGISPEYHKIIFERFRQVEPEDPRRVAPGLGFPYRRRLPN